ncbi:MAG: DHH family phosphoesterase, partial [Prevotellaceae bacterium]|nr:DHH family phosphoesterase [Prevotellaceae bacterium]
MTTKWKICLLNDQQKKQAKELANELNINEILAQLLVQRGLGTFADARDFFRPQLSKLHDPFLMKDMDKAVERLNQALAQKEKILVYGDYDVDGTTAVALVYKFLKQFHSEIDYYLPDRYNEGYGISYAGIDYAAENGFSLVIALDCGIKAVEKMEYAREKGVEFIICDHHTPDDEIPRAVAVLDPKRNDCEYPYKHLCGCGVGFKLMQAFSQSNGIDEATHLMPLLDLVVVSIASDIVPITEENRILAYYGLRQLNTNPCMGLKAIIDITGLADREILVSDIVFKIGPRINASGR